MPDAKIPELPPGKDPPPGFVRGIVHAFCETGTEGTVWSVQDEKGISPDGKHWTYEGLNCLQDGDYLRIFNDAARKNLAWEGEIKLKHPPATYLNRGVQEGVNEDAWMRLFYDQKPAILILKDTWSKMKADARNKAAEEESARQRIKAEIGTACHEGVDVKFKKPFKLKRPGR